MNFSDEINKLKIASFIFGIIFLVSGICSMAQAEPAPTAKSISWDHSGANLGGFNIYWAMESDEAPRDYSDIRKIDVQNETARSVLLLAVKPDSTDSMCFRLTAYNLSGKESGYSDEVCGFFGFQAVTNLRIE